jgi:predicted Zn-dependent protease
MPVSHLTGPYRSLKLNSSAEFRVLFNVAGLYYIVRIYNILASQLFKEALLLTRIYRKSIYMVSFAALLWGLVACAVNPVTGKHQLMLLTEQGEVDLGAQTDQSIVQQYGLYADGGLQSYLPSVGMPIARISHRPDLAWKFKVMDSPVVNAFAAPGGYIYVTRGLLASVNNEAELAGILGHEIGHVTARHSASQYSNMMLANVGLGVGKTLLGNYGAALGPLMDAGTGLLFLKFSRDNEREADSLGVEYASRAGYDAARLADFFDSLQQMKTLGQTGSASQLPEFFSTHPNPVNRQKTVRSMATEWQKRLSNQAFRVNQDQYLERIDGLVYGDDPRKGFREDNHYYWPELGVQFLLPQSWLFEREGTQIQILHPDKRGLVMIGVERGGNIEQISSRFVSSLQGKVLDSQDSTVDGMPSKELLVLMIDGGKRLLLLSRYFLKNNQVFMFHALCAEKEFAAIRTELSLPAASFSLIKDPQKLNPRRQRIHVQAVSQSMTLQNALQAFGVNAQDWDRIAWLNAMQLKDMLAPGQKIKLLK